MRKRQLLKQQIRVLQIDSIERARDLLNLSIPIFITTGVLVACVKFWLWVFA